MAVAELYVNAGKKGLDTELKSMLAHPVVTKARNRSSHGYARGVRHQSHRIFRAERELLGVSEDQIRVRRKPIDKKWIEHELMVTDIMGGFEAAAEIVPLGSQSLTGEVWHAGEPIKLEIETDYSFRMDVDGKPRTYHVE